ncbi:MAG: hypothetical protein VW339_15045, partial [Quisquiliibacterium sp.]
MNRPTRRAGRATSPQISGYKTPVAIERRWKRLLSACARIARARTSNQLLVRITDPLAEILRAQRILLVLDAPKRHGMFQVVSS